MTITRRDPRHTEDSLEPTQGNDLLTRLALTLFDCGAVPFGAFPLKLHEKYPDAPLSPMKVELRTPDHPKGGLLTPEALSLIGSALCTLDTGYVEAVCGIPYAGDRLADAYMDADRQFGSSKLRVRLEKREVDDGKRAITKVTDDSVCRGCRRILLIDDVITGANTKREAIRALNDAEMSVVSIAVVVDREQGGTEELLRGGYGFQIHSLFTLNSLLKIGHEHGRVTDAQMREVAEYQAAEAARRAALTDVITT
jgi:orotate phosphoribosyltransferase